jgi:hypothetical protein
MTPKEKAIELIKKFSSFAHDEFGHEKINNYKAKQCALIAVDEIISTFAIMGLGSKFYEEVKQEIANL